MCRRCWRGAPSWSHLAACDARCEAPSIRLSRQPASRAFRGFSAVYPALRTCAPRPGQGTSPTPDANDAVSCFGHQEMPCRTGWSTQRRTPMTNRPGCAASVDHAVPVARTKTKMRRHRAASSPPGAGTWPGHGGLRPPAGHPVARSVHIDQRPGRQPSWSTAERLSQGRPGIKRDPSNSDDRV